jgi:hypothetical protein
MSPWPETDFFWAVKAIDGYAIAFILSCCLKGKKAALLQDAIMALMLTTWVYMMGLWFCRVLNFY